MANEMLSQLQLWKARPPRAFLKWEEVKVPFPEWQIAAWYNKALFVGVVVDRGSVIAKPDEFHVSLARNYPGHGGSTPYYQWYSKQVRSEQEARRIAEHIMKNPIAFVLDVAGAEPERLLKYLQEHHIIKAASLRSAVTKLAHDHPELRQHLVPLLRRTAGDRNLKLVEQASVTGTTGSIVSMGSLDQIESFARGQQMKWRDNSSLFGGYWRTPNGNAYLLDVASPGDRVGKQSPIPGGI